MQHILIPTDFSDNSLNAALYAMDLFVQNVHLYTVVNCYDLPAYGDSSMVDITEHLARASREGLDAFQLKLLNVLPNKDLRVDYESEHGRLDRVVQNYGRRANIPAVSYTHLRAHETVLDLVCRLLLEKKNKPFYHALQSWFTT